MADQSKDAPRAAPPAARAGTRRPGRALRQAAADRWPALLLVLTSGLGVALLLRGADWPRELAVGLLGAALVGIVLVQRGRELRRTRHYLHALESLNEISVAVSRQLGSGQRVLEQLVESSRRLLTMDRAGISLIDRRAGTLRIVASAGDMPQSFPHVLPLAELPATVRSLESGRVEFVEDVSDYPLPVNAQTALLFRAGSFMLIPLSFDDQTGLLSLSGSRPRRYTAADRRLAQLLGSQAAVILANSRLYQLMADALQARAILLRELNHRVKNNLARIAALLSVNRPPLAADAARWLDRAVQRIDTMARAHELFSGGSPTIGLAQLAEQVVAALAVVKPPGIDARIDFGEVDVHLPTDQAVSLMMVLHELCYNALVHGLRGGGALTIRARTAGQHDLAVEVADTGPGFASAGPAGYDIAPSTGTVPSRETSSTGFGLELVEGLVSRELRGQFSLTSRQGTGTVATVVFPLAHDAPQEWCDDRGNVQFRQPESPDRGG